MPLPSATFHEVVWTDFVNCYADTSNILICTAPTPDEWAGGAGSVSGIPTGVDGYAQYTANMDGRAVIGGLTNGNPDHDWTTVQYGWYTDGAGSCSVNESGAAGGYTGTYAADDLMQVAVIGGQIYYYQNGTLKLTSSLISVHYPLVFDCSIRDVGGVVKDASLYADTLVALRPAPPYYGQDYAGNRNTPSSLRIVAAIGDSLELTELTGNQTDVWVDRQSISIQRSNQDAASAIASFEVILPNRSFADIPANRYIAIDDPQTPNGQGGALGYFAGYTMQPTPQEPHGGERTITVHCQDFGVLLQKPPKQIITQWPPGDGTPVVNTTVPDSISPGTVTITPVSMRHIYVGKKLIAQNSDGSNRETITVTAVTDTTFDAVFASSKTSSTTTVPGSLHATGSQTVTPDDMTNIVVGSLLYCQKHHGDQTVGNEYVVVTAITSTTFTAFFQYWKTHDWTVTNNWEILGGISDKELIADGFKMSIDSVDPTTGDVTTTLEDIPSLLDYCYNNEGFSVDKSGVEEIIPSLPHGAWTGATPADVLKWVAQQNSDSSKQVRDYMSFVQPTSFTFSALTPMLRHYDAYAVEHKAKIALTNQQAQIDTLTQGRWRDAYQYPEDGQSFANKLTVLGDLDSVGYWIDDGSVSDTSAPNYVGRVIEAQPVTDNTCTTNDECALRAAEIALQKQLSTRQKSVTVSTYVQLDPRVLYEPQLVEFDAEFEHDSTADLEVRTVTLSFDSDDLAKYSFQLGQPQSPQRFYTQTPPARYREATVRTGRDGKVTVAGPPTTRYVSEHVQLTGDATLYVADTSDQAISLFLPRASYYPGLPVRVRVPSGASNNATVHAYQRDGVLDTVDGANSVDVAPGQGIILQSAGEHDVRGHGAVWHQVGNMAGATGTPWLLGGNAPGTDSVFGTQDDFDISFIRDDVEWAHLSASEYDLLTPVYIEIDPTTDFKTTLQSYIFQGAAGTVAMAADAEAYENAPSGTQADIIGVNGAAGSKSTNVADITRAVGVRGSTVLGGAGAVSQAISLKGDAALTTGLTPPTPDQAISVYGATQTIGTQNWSGYFEGDVKIGGKLVGTNLSINLPIATGAVPVAGLYVPVITDIASTIVAVRVMLFDATGAAVSDTCTLNIKRTDFATGTTADLNPSTFGPSAAYNYEDTTLVADGWAVDLAAHDTLQAELVSAPASAVSIAISLEVVRA